jgi:putative phage-type endonuclease
VSAVLIPTASEAEWLEARRGGITASEIAVVMGLSPYESPFALYHRKLGILPPPEDTDAMRIGRHLEYLVCEMFGERHPEFVQLGDGRGLWRHPDRRWQMATPDRLLHEHHGEPRGWSPPIAVLEAKTAASYDGWGNGDSDEIPVHYRCQVLWQMDVMGTGTAFVACLFLHARQLRVYEITLDAAAKDDLELMRREAQWFLFHHVAAKNAPDVDWRPATTEALKTLHPLIEDRHVVVPARLAARYRAACKAVKAAERRKALTENLIRARLGTASRVMDGATGQLLASRQVYEVPAKTVERKAFTVDKLMPAKPKEVKTP